MKIEEGNADKTARIDKRFSISLILALVIFMISGSAATMSYAAPQTLPTCVDPTGQNLTCIMFISTLPPPKNTLQCQETSGQIFKCTYIVDKLSNGNRIVAITVYVPANFVFSSPTEIKVVEHETITKTTTKTKIIFVTPCLKTQKWNPLTHKCEDICPPVKPGQKNVNPIFPSGCPTLPPPCVVKKPCPIPPPCDSKYYTGPCPPTDPNALTKCISAALVANDNKGVLGCAPLLPDTPENALTKCISAGLLANDNNAVLKCAKLLPSTNGASNNMTNTTTSAATPLANTSAAIQPTNTSIPASGGSGTGSACVNNCTTGTPPPVDCNANPNDPSCTQTLTPPPQPTTKTCPDGSVIDASATCPTQSSPSTPSSPDNNNPPPTNNNPSPPSNGNNGNGGSDKGSSSPQPSTMS